MFLNGRLCTKKVVLVESTHKRVFRFIQKAGGPEPNRYPRGYQNDVLIMTKTKK